MRYYIIDNRGNVLGEDETKHGAEARMYAWYTEQEIAEYEIEVVSDDIGEE